MTTTNPIPTQQETLPIRDEAVRLCLAMGLPDNHACIRLAENYLNSRAAVVGRRGDAQCLICDSSERRLHAYADHPFVCALDLEIAKREFLSASIAVWREIDRLSALPDGYNGLPQGTDPRKRELAAWEVYRGLLDALAKHTPAETLRPI